MADRIDWDEFCDVIAHTLKIDKGSITPQALFIDDLKADSLDLVELTMAFEDKYLVKIDDEDFSKIRTAQDAFNLINHKLSEGA